MPIPALKLEQLRLTEERIVLAELRLSDLRAGSALRITGVRVTAPIDVTETIEASLTALRYQRSLILDAIEDIRTGRLRDREGSFID